MKKLIALTLCLLMAFSCLALPVSAATSAAPQAVADTINVPSSTFGTTFIRTIMNIFRGLFRMEPMVTSVEIEDGPQVTLKPVGTNATYTVYFYDSAVNGKQNISGHTSQPANADSGYVVVVTSDGFVSKATKVKYNSVKQKYALKYDANGGYFQVPGDVTGEKTVLTYYFEEGESVIIPAYLRQHYNSTWGGIYREGYEFAGWDPAIPSKMPGKNITVKAIWNETDPLADYEGPFEVALVGNSVTIKGLKSSAASTQDIEIPEEINGYPVTSIGDEAFKGNTTLRYVLANTITSVGREAFSGCTSLEIFHAADLWTVGAEAFYNCNSLSDVSGDELITIGERAFKNCYLLQIEPEYLKAVPEEAFMNCYNIKLVSSPELSGIGDRAFMNCTALKWVQINTSSSVGEEAFSGCISLVNFDSSPISIGKRAFYNCQALLSNIDLDSVESVPEEAFYNCRALSNAIYLRRVQSIGNKAFYGCSAIKAIMCNYITSVGSEAFSGCTSLMSFGSMPLSIGYRAFYNCTSLYSIGPDNLMGEEARVGEEAFYNCSALRLEVRSTQTIVGTNAFYGIAMLTVNSDVAANEDYPWGASNVTVA